MATRKNVISYGDGPQPGQLIVGNGADGTKTTIFNASTATTASHMFYGCASLTSWTVDLPKLTSGYYMFYGCHGLTEWTVDLPKLTNGSNMFYECHGLTEWTAALPKLTSGYTMFRNCPALTSWTVDMPELTNGQDMFRGCTGLTSWTTDLTKLTIGNSMFDGCTLDEPSVIRILTSIPTYSSGSHNLHLGKLTYFLDSTDIATLLGTTTPIVAGTYSCKGWTITVTN